MKAHIVASTRKEDGGIDDIVRRLLAAHVRMIAGALPPQWLEPIRGLDRKVSSRIVGLAVTARRPGPDNSRLFRYFPGRKPWCLEADVQPYELEPCEVPTP
jgi:hypothetical protein